MPLSQRLLKNASPQESASTQLSITVFKGLCLCIFFVTIALIGSQEFSNISTIQKNALTISKDRLPEFIENQKTLANIENLRRIAEVTNVSSNPRDRRHARISAEALTTESIFDRDPGFRSAARNISTAIKELVTAKNEVDSLHETLAKLDAQHTNLVEELASTALNAKDAIQILHLATLRPTTASVQKTRPLAEEQAFTATLIKDMRHISQNAIEKNPASKNQAQQLLEAIVGNLELRLLQLEEINAKTIQVQKIWKIIDNNLRAMRDSVTTGSEVAISSSLLSIRDTASHTLHTSIFLYSIILLFFLLYFVAEHFLITKPLRWTSAKLAAIQEGRLDTEQPTVYIKEIFHVTELLDRFSTHLAELYHHANTLEEDAAKKRNLEEIMRAVFRVSLDGYVVWDAERVISVSEGARALLELETEQDFLPYWEQSGQLQAKAEEVFAKAHSLAWREDMDLLLHTGKNIPCEVTHLLVTFDEKKCILSYIRDLREQKRNEHALVIAKEQAEVATQAKGEFLARMSHEIRTPMNGVIGLTRMALESSPSPRQQELLEKIQASARILLGVINDILDFSKIEQGKLQLENQPFSLQAVFTTISDLLEPQATQKGVAFVVKLEEPPLGDLTLIGDSLRLSQILLNLCGNGIKFTEEGSVTLMASVLGREPGQVLVHFSVKDTGIGIDSEQQGSLFQAFAQADSSTTRRYGGTGLGLMISKLLVEQMGGEVSLHSVPGQGSDFSFSLRLSIAGETPSDQMAPAARQLANATLFTGKTLLVAEDNEINQEIIIAFLEELESHVIIANNGQEALQLFQTSQVDCILMDIQMPIMDGLTATRSIRALPNHPKAKTIPIIAMTAHVLHEDIQKSLDAGMSAHLTKPIDYQALIACLTKFIGPDSPSSC